MGKDIQPNTVLAIHDRVYIASAKKMGNDPKHGAMESIPA
jgi:hypothetical protein